MLDNFCPLSTEQITSLLRLGYESNSIITAFNPNCKKDKQAFAILQLYKIWQQEAKNQAFEFEEKASLLRQEMKGEFLREHPDNQKRFEISDQTGEVLEDYRPWAEKKGEGDQLVNSYKRLKMMKKAEAVENCGTLLQFKECPQGHEKK